MNYFLFNMKIKLAYSFICQTKPFDITILTFGMNETNSIIFENIYYYGTL